MSLLSGRAALVTLAIMVSNVAACGGVSIGYQAMTCSEYLRKSSSFISNPDREAAVKESSEALQEVRQMMRDYGLDPSAAAPEEFNTGGGTRRPIGEVVVMSLDEKCPGNHEAKINEMIDWDLLGSADQFEAESVDVARDTGPGEWTFEKAAALLESLDLGLECGTPSMGQKDVMECINRSTFHDWAVVIPPLNDAWVEERIDACEFGKKTPHNFQSQMSVVTDGSSLVVWELMAPEGSPVDGGPAIAAELESAGTQGLRVEPFCPG
ncbi:H-NS histone family protein [Mycobacterium sp. SMC-4]|uniref:H-NS histone family protein n=1 Tax=Mycobacterium sp. SMC-4 TaxID=2857059 RepID=UPI0021B42A2B|nr:H-NS histone family protein [Mycobacterium sp. SMC-4]UXA19086.1 H-NS histone family protein [Mycobacterium sp. SMC-4]